MSDIATVVAMATRYESLNYTETVQVDESPLGLESQTACGLVTFCASFSVAGAETVCFRRWAFSALAISSPTERNRVGVRCAQL